MSVRSNRADLFQPKFHAVRLVCQVAVLFAAVNLCAAEIRSERWRWSNPLPHGNNVMDMLVTSNLAAQVGDGGSFYFQDETERWAPANTGLTNYLRGVALMGQRLIAVGEDGCILWSDDGSVFQKAQLQTPTADWFEAVAASSQWAVAVGDNGAIYTSANGADWTKAVSATTEWLRGVACGSSGFVAVGENGVILKSGNSAGTSWTVITNNPAYHLNRVRYLSTSSGNVFIAVGTRGEAFSSATGSAPWVSLASGTTNTLFDAAANSTGLLLVGDQEIRFRTSDGAWTNQITDLSTNAPQAWTYYSACGGTNSWLGAGRAGLLVEGVRASDAFAFEWAPVFDSSHAWLWDVTVQKGICVAVGDLATIQTSLDGILWAREAVPGPYTNVVLLGVGGTTNLLLAAGSGGNLFYSCAGLTNMTITNHIGTNVVVTNATFDTLGMIWANVPAFTTNTLQGVAASADLYAVVGDRGCIYTSPNGTNWTPRPSPTTNFLSALTSSPLGWAAVGNRGTILRSDTGETWAKLALSTTNWIYRVRHVGGAMVAVGQNGVIYTSADSVNWSSRTSGTKAWLNDVSFLDGKWWVVGTQGTLLFSSNLTSWVATPIPTVKSLYGAAAHDGKLLAVGVEGVILRNQVEPIATCVNFLGYNRDVVTSGIGTNAYMAAYELFLFGGMPDQYFQLESSTSLSGGWASNAVLEVFDPSGTIYLIRTRSLTNTPASEYYRTRAIP